MWLCFVCSIFESPFKSERRLEAENAALQHQLMVLRRQTRGWVNSPTSIGCFESIFIAGIRRFCAWSTSFDRRLLSTGIGRAFATTGVGNRRAEGMSRDPAHAVAVTFKSADAPDVGEFSDAVVLS
jgi:hypothetical protein